MPMRSLVWMARVCVARDSRYVYSGACGVDRHSVFSQPRAEERAWGGLESSVTGYLRPGTRPLETILALALPDPDWFYGTIGVPPE